MKKHGWAIEDMEEGGFMDESLGCFPDNNTKGRNPVDRAKVFITRKQAREAGCKLDTDVIRKVELDEDGTPVKVIPGR
jgi:hypothetical protein